MARSPNNFVPGTDLNAGRYYNIWQLSTDYELNSQLQFGVLYGVMRDPTGGSADLRCGNVGAFCERSWGTIFYSLARYMKNPSAVRIVAPDCDCRDNLLG